MRAQSDLRRVPLPEARGRPGLVLCLYAGQDCGVCGGPLRGCVGFVELQCRAAAGPGEIYDTVSVVAYCDAIRRLRLRGCYEVVEADFVGGFGHGREAESEEDESADAACESD